MSEGPSEDPRRERREERERAVEAQLVARGIRDPRVLSAMSAVPRHRFVPESLRPYAYQDRALPHSHGQTISQPYIVARMTELARVRRGARVLEVGTGSAYQSAVLLELGAELYSIEVVEALHAQAGPLLRALGYEGFHLRLGDGYEGWPEAAPFEAILLTAAPPRIPPPLLAQLALGGTLVAPIGTWHQELCSFTREPEGLREEHHFEVRFVPMTGRAQEEEAAS